MAVAVWSRRACLRWGRLTQLLSRVEEGELTRTWIISDQMSLIQQKERVQLGDLPRITYLARASLLLNANTAFLKMRPFKIPVLEA